MGPTLFIFSVIRQAEPWLPGSDSTLSTPQAVGYYLSLLFAVVAASIAIATASWYLVERPGMALGKKLQIW